MTMARFKAPFPAFALLHEGGRMKLVYVVPPLGGLRDMFRVFRWTGFHWSKRAAWVPHENLHALPRGMMIDSVTIPYLPR